MANQNEIMATRTTIDGAQVQFWTDGAVTMGNPRQHMPFVARGLAARWAWLVADDVGLYLASEVKGLIKAVRKAAACYAPGSRAAGFLGIHDHEIRRLMRAFAPAWKETATAA